MHQSSVGPVEEIDVSAAEEALVLLTCSDEADSRQIPTGNGMHAQVTQSSKVCQPAAQSGGE